MNALWFAFIIYIAGMAVVLYFRPSLMFDGGAWKEFGLTTTHNNTTIFPFWMFVIVWSIASYTVGTLCVIGFSGVSTQNSATPEDIVTVNQELLEPSSNSEANESINDSEPIKPKPRRAAKEDLEFNETLEEVLEEAPRRRHRKKKAKPVPGYYVKGVVNGKPTYVYYGKNPPG